MSTQVVIHPSSYRDPSGFIFEKGGIIYRQVNISFKDDFDFFINSGCYTALTGKGLLIPHEPIQENLTGSDQFYRTLLPEKIDFISYPYEWSFDMFKDAALLTLQLLKESISYGLIVKDASPYNIQWHKGKLIFIDTLSFEKYKETEPWIAYRQFCECFLGPLLLMHYNKVPLHSLSLAYPDGIPLTVIKSLLPGKSRFSLHTYLHIHLHAKISNRDKPADNKTTGFSKQKLLNLISSLETLIQGLRFTIQQSAWSDYYEEAATRNNYLDQKKKIITGWISGRTDIRTAADLGANEGEFSRLLSEKKIQVVAADYDPWCINKLYQEIKSNGIQNIQPMILDISNPSPAIGVNNEERQSFVQRCQTDLVLALAVIHHLAIGKNIPFEKIAAFFSKTGKDLIIEFIPKEDEKIQGMLKTKKDIYANYTEENFTEAFEKFYSVTFRQSIGGTGRVLYRMKRKD
ncbi:MAG: SAM-dependent methyltransferase [Bacteroidota bacterium]